MPVADFVKKCLLDCAIHLTLFSIVRFPDIPNYDSREDRLTRLTNYCMMLTSLSRDKLVL